MVDYLKQKEPYFLLFIVGIVSAILGAYVWISFNFTGNGTYPRDGHAALMFFGFLGSFVAGFLMTAVPKMTGTSSATQVELGTVVSAALLMNLFAFANKPEIAAWIYLVELVLLTAFVVRRFLKIRRLPFASMVFIPIALIGAVLSLLFYFLSGAASMALVTRFAGEVFILNLICGLGVRLVPMISRFPNAVSPEQQAARLTYSKVLFQAVFLNGLFWLDSFSDRIELNLAIAGFLLVYFIRSFGLFKRPGLQSRIGWGLKVGQVSLVAGYLLSAFNFFPVVAAKHLIYIGGFTLITMLISARVVLAHGGKNLEYELKSPWILPLALTMAIVAIMRVEAGANVMGTLMRVIPFLFLGAVLTWYVRLFRAK